MIFLLAWLALAQEPVSIEEVTVWGDAAVLQLRSAVVRRMRELGYREAERSDGRVLFKPPRRWMGRVWLEPSGDLTFLRPVVAWKSPELVDHPSIESTPAFERNPEGISEGASMQGAAALWVLPAERLLTPERERVRDGVSSELEAYVATIRETRFREILDGLPDRLDALWSGGAPLQPGDPPAGSPAQRRAGVLFYWATRPDTREGLEVSLAVERWIRNTLQDTPDAVTRSEAERASSDRADGRMLDLSFGP